MERGMAAVGVADVCVRAERLADRYHELASRAAAEAVRWRWATPSSGHGFVEPLRLERMGCSPGRWLDRAPLGGREYEAIGFDAVDRVVCVRQHDVTGEVWLARFARWSAEEVEVACFRPPLADGGFPARLQCLTVLRLGAGLPVASERYLPPTRSLSRERYAYERGRLVRVNEGEGVIKEIVYGADGVIAGVDALEGGARRAVWRAGRDHRPG